MSLALTQANVPAIRAACGAIEQTVLFRLNGLEGYPKQSYANVGERLTLGEDTIKAIEARALVKMGAV